MVVQFQSTVIVDWCSYLIMHSLLLLTLFILLTILTASAVSVPSQLQERPSHYIYYIANRMSEEMQDSQQQMIDVFELAVDRLRSQDSLADSLISHKPQLLEVEEEEPPQNMGLLIPKCPFLGGDSELGEVLPQVDSVSSLPSEKEQLEEKPVEKPSPVNKVKRERPKLGPTRRKSLSPSGEEEEEEWVDEKLLRGKKKPKTNEAPKKKGLESAREKGEHVTDATVKGKAQSKSNQCSCKKSQCTKKYCQCFNSGNPCGESCKCEGCKNQVLGVQQHQQ